MFGLRSLSDLPKLPKYKLDSNRQIVIDELENEEDQSIESIEQNDIETDSYNNELKNEAPMPSGEEENLNAGKIKNENLINKENRKEENNG